MLKSHILWANMCEKNRNAFWNGYDNHFLVPTDLDAFAVPQNTHTPNFMLSPQIENFNENYGIKCWTT